MKNYYDQKRELELTKSRLETLQEKKRIYFEETQPKSKEFKGVMVNGSRIESNKNLTYMVKTEEIDKEIEIKLKEIKILEKNIKKMEHHLREMEGILEQVFVARYIDGKKVKQIAKQLHYSPSHIYTLLEEVKKITNSKK